MANCKLATTYFLIAGNTRTGSTWLQTSLDGLNGIGCASELRFQRPGGAKIQPPQLQITPDEESFAPLIEKACGHRVDKTKGARLKLDPHGFISRDAINKLRKMVNPQMKYIHLRRSYFEIFSTLKSRGIVHKFNPRALHRARSKNILRQRIKEFKAVSTPVVITDNGRSLWPEEIQNAAYCSLTDAIEDMIILMFNDIAFYQIGKNANFSMVSYDQISDKLSDIALSLNKKLNREDIEAVIKNPMTLKLETNDQVVFPEKQLIDISNVLNDTFINYVESGNMPINWGKGIEIIADGLYEVIKFHNLSMKNLRIANTWKCLINRSRSIWVAGSPVYDPLSVD